MVCCMVCPKVTYWVVESIVAMAELELRMEVLVKFIRMAEHLQVGRSGRRRG
jgi:hypothetical protein